MKELSGGNSKMQMPACLSKKYTGNTDREDRNMTRPRVFTTRSPACATSADTGLERGAPPSSPVLKGLVDIARLVTQRI
jgi:hypothetical protein